MKEKKGRGNAFLAAFLAGLLFVGCVMNVQLARTPVSRYVSGEMGFSQLVKEIKGAYAENVLGKTSFVELGGAMARITGRHVYHGVSVLENGMLDREWLSPTDTRELGREIVGMKNLLAERKTPFLYVQVPCKVDVGGELVREGVAHYGLQDADELMQGLLADGVEVLDLRPTLTGCVEDVERYFYRTDHHWNADGALLATQTVLSRLSSLLGKALDERVLSDGQWERCVYEDWFLGSHGKRVGRYYGGVDDLVIRTPRFETAMQMQIPLHDVCLKGSFEEVVLRQEYLDAPDYYEENPYCVYIGGDYPVVRHQNTKAPNGLSILLIKDSFSLPVEAFLSAAVRDLEVMDPRYYREGTVMEYIGAREYDAVIMMINPSVFEDAHYKNLGV